LGKNNIQTKIKLSDSFSCKFAWEAVVTLMSEDSDVAVVTAC